MLPRFGCFWLLALLLPFTVTAQVLPAGGGSGAPFTNAACVQQVVTGITAQGGVVCSTLNAAMVDNSVAKTGTDISTSHEVIATHLIAPLPFAQGGHGLSSGAQGGLLWFPTTTSLGSTFTLPLNMPVIGGGTFQPPSTGTVSGNTTEFASVAGPKTATRQLQYDANGNVSASVFPPGVPTQPGLTWNIATSFCTGDSNGGKLTITGGRSEERRV